MGTVNFDVFFLGLSSESPIAHRESSIANRESTLSGRSLFDRANAHTKVCHSVLRSPEPSRTTFQGLRKTVTHSARLRLSPPTWGSFRFTRAASSLRHARDHHPAVPNRLSETLYALSRFVGDSPYDAIRPKPDRTTPTAGSAARLCRSWKLTSVKSVSPIGPTRADLPPAWIHRNDDLPRRNHRV